MFIIFTTICCVSPFVEFLTEVLHYKPFRATHIFEFSGMIRLLGLFTFVLLFLKFLPVEMLELILNSSYLGIISSEWNSTVLRRSTLFSGYSLYREVSSSVETTAYTTIKSVTNEWNSFVRLKRGYLLKSCEYTRAILSRRPAFEHRLFTIIISSIHFVLIRTRSRSRSRSRSLT